MRQTVAADVGRERDPEQSLRRHRFERVTWEAVEPLVAAGDAMRDGLDRPGGEVAHPQTKVANLVRGQQVVIQLVGHARDGGRGGRCLRD